ncbi:hypothetical protein PENTCL1PPCAC_5543, partial [Pristionchus entomophagus]
ATAYARHLQTRHKSSLKSNGVYLLCSCGTEIRYVYYDSNHTEKCGGLQFSLRQLEKKITPKCILCEMYPSTPIGYFEHLRIHHKSTLKESGIYLICSCGLE